MNDFIQAKLPIAETSVEIAIEMLKDGRVLDTALSLNALAAVLATWDKQLKKEEVIVA